MSVISMTGHKRRRRVTWTRTALLCLLSAATGSAATVYVLRPDALVISEKSPSYSRPLKLSQVQGPSKLIVVDRDTVKSPFGVKYRLMGFDAPETWRPECDKERALGEKATARLQELISSGAARIIEKGKGDKYGRTLATLTVNGRDVGPILIGEGLARPHKGGKRKSWCDL